MMAFRSGFHLRGGLFAAIFLSYFSTSLEMTKRTYAAIPNANEFEVGALNYEHSNFIFRSSNL